MIRFLKLYSKWFRKFNQKNCLLLRSSKLDESLISNYVVTMKYKTFTYTIFKFKLFWVGIRSSTNLVILIWIPWPSKVITISIHYFHFYSNNSKKNELNFLIFFCLIRNRFWFWKIFRCTYVPWKLLHGRNGMS